MLMAITLWLLMNGGLPFSCQMLKGRERESYVFIPRIHSQMALTMNRQQGSSKESFPGWENFVTAVAFHLILPQLACNILVSWEALFR